MSCACRPTGRARSRYRLPVQGFEADAHGGARCVAARIDPRADALCTSAPLNFGSSASVKCRVTCSGAELTVLPTAGLALSSRAWASALGATTRVEKASAAIVR